MPLLSRKSLLAIAAVTDVALNARAGALSGKALANPWARRGIGFRKNTGSQEARDFEYLFGKRHLSRWNRISEK
jgi:hypothetical protein